MGRERIWMTGLTRRAFGKIFSMLNDTFALVTDVRRPVEVMLDCLSTDMKSERLLAYRYVAIDTVDDMRH